MKIKRNLLLGGGLAGLVLLATQRDNSPTMKEHGSIKAPVYSSSTVPTNMCSRYVRLAAKDLFGIEYPSADAWDIRDDQHVKEIVLGDFNSLRRLVDEDKITPGMIIGFYNPSSKYNSRAQEDGAGYTHVMLYVGKDGSEPVLADKFGKETRVLSLEELSKTKIVPKEAMYISRD